MEEEIEKTCKILQKGGVILYPTDTVWGIGCDATNWDAVKKIYEIKQRPDTKSMLVLVDSVDCLNHYVTNVPEIARNLIALSNKPLTIIYPEAKNVASNLIAPDGTLGIRVTQEIFSQKLCQQLKKPIVSTSANISGNSAPENFSKINDKIIRSVDYVVNYKQTETQIIRPSGIIKIGKDGLVQIIRE
jgi:L-threonylcarbamoyladenylate synthase